MIYLFSGNDTNKKLKAIEVFLGREGKGLEIFSIGKGDFDSMQMESFYSSTGLFFSKSLILLSGVLDREEYREFIVDNLDKMESSPNIFLFSEGKLKKPILDAFKKALPAQAGRAEINIFEQISLKKESFNSFLLANALGDRNKLQLWIYFRQAMENGIMLEALLGILHWKMKDMILKKSFQKFTERELQRIDMRLSYLLPEARKNRQDDEAVFEKFLLEAF